MVQFADEIVVVTKTEQRAQQHYDRIAQAIDYLSQNIQDQPSLEQIAEHIHMSPTHFQRLFSDWAGTSPKKFLQYLSIEHAKGLLKQNQGSSLLQTSLAMGLSSTSRLHDLFIQIEGMTPAQYKNGGRDLSIYYFFSETLFGTVLVAATDKGICAMSFETAQASAVEKLQQAFPSALLIEQQHPFHLRALAIFDQQQPDLSQLKLHLKGSDFQLKVWQCLLKIPLGQLTSYGEIAQQIGQPQASRAVGTAIGRNPIAFLIPCHRVIQASGQLGGYRWGETRKKAMIAWEAVQTERVTV